MTRAWSSGAVPKVLAGLAALYLASVWLGAVGSGIPYRLLPRWAVYFTQTACLFPRAAIDVINYRAEGWVCSQEGWTEIDVRPDFPVDPDDKENRFARVMHFYRSNRRVMHALDAYLVSRYNGRLRAAMGAGPAEAGRIGGVRLMSLRIPIPAPGQHVERYRRKLLDQYPEAWRHYFYWTPRTVRDERCGGVGDGSMTP